MATVAATIGKLKRRAEASRSESISIATSAGGFQTASGVGQTTPGLGQRKLLSTSGGGQGTLSESKRQLEEQRAQQIRRAFKALTNSAGTAAGGPAVGPKMSFSAASGKSTDQTSLPASQTAGGGGTLQPLSKREGSLDEESSKSKQQQQFKPKLNAAISDIHEWWNYQIN